MSDPAPAETPVRDAIALARDDRSRPSPPVDRAKKK